MAERIRALWERIKADIQRNPGLWIGVGLTAVILVIAYLAYRRSQGQGLVPANGYGFPDYGSSGGGDSGGGGGGYAPYQPGNPFNPTAPTFNPFNPTAPTFPTFPTFPPFSFGPPSGGSGGSGSSAGSEDTAATGLAAYTVQGNIQNPSAAQDAQHRGTAPGTGQGVTVPGIPIQSPLAPAQQAHKGSQPVLPVPVQSPTAPAQQAHKGSPPPPPPPPKKQSKKQSKPAPPPATLQPTNSGHGRAA